MASEWPDQTMARSRIIKHGFFTNEVLAELPPFGRLLFAGLWILADREGRLEDRPRRIKASLFPWDEVDVQALLDALESKGFIDRYVVSGMPVIQVAKFAEHQTPHVREAASILPGPPCESEPAGAQPVQGSARPSPRSPVSVSVSDSVSISVDSSASPATTEPPVLTFPTSGRPDSWHLTAAQVEEWQRLYDGLDVRAECKKALAWVKSNPGHKKTPGGMPRFLVNWLSRATNSGRGTKLSPVVAVRDYVWPCPHGGSHGSQTLCRNQQIIDRARGKAS